MHLGGTGALVEECTQIGELSESGYLPLPKSGGIKESMMKRLFPKKVWLSNPKCAEEFATLKNCEYAGFYLADKQGKNFRQMTLYRKWILKQLISGGDKFSKALISCFADPTRTTHGEDTEYLESVLVAGLIERRDGTFFEKGPGWKGYRYAEEPTIYTLLITNFVCDLASISQVENFLSHGNNYHSAVEDVHVPAPGWEISDQTYFMLIEKHGLESDSGLIDQCLLTPQSTLMGYLLDYLKYDPNKQFYVPKPTPRKPSGEAAAKKQKTEPTNDNFVWKNLKTRAGYLIGREVLAMVDFGGRVVRPSSFTESCFNLFHEKLIQLTQTKCTMPLVTNWTVVADLIGRFIFFSDCWQLVKVTHQSWGRKPKSSDTANSGLGDWRDNTGGVAEPKKSELLFEPTLKMKGFPSIDKIVKPVSISQIFQLVICGQMFHKPEDEIPFFDITESVEINGNPIKSQMNAKFQFALDWKWAGSNRDDTEVGGGTRPHFSNLASEMLKQSKKYLLNGTLKTDSQLTKSNMEAPSKVPNQPTTILEQARLASRLLEMSELFSSMEKWAAMNYAILKNTKYANDYKVEHYAKFPVDDRNLLFCDVSTQQVQKDILTMKELVQNMGDGDQLNASKIDDILPITSILECAKKPAVTLHLGTGEQGDDLESFQKILFEKANLKSMTKEVFDDEVEK